MRMNSLSLQPVVFAGCSDRQLTQQLTKQGVELLVSKTHICSALMLLFCITQTALAFEGDYVWEERFKASLEKVRSNKASDQYTLGDMYLSGRGTTMDHKKALHWLLLAAKQNHRKAAYKVGYLYLYGEDLTHKPKQALAWFRRSAQAGHAPAQYELGKLFISGKAGQRDNARALKWLGKAKAAHYGPAEVEFSQVVGRLTKSGRMTTR